MQNGRFATLVTHMRLGSTIAAILCFASLAAACGQGDRGLAGVNIPDTGVAGFGGTAGTPVASVTMTPNSGSIAIGDTLRVAVATRDEAGGLLTGRTITFSSSDSSIATVSASGTVRGKLAGSVTITAASEAKSGFGHFQVHP
jgi:trimeric autotransporter adhesin